MSDLDFHKDIERVETAANSIREFVDGVWEGTEGLEAIAESLEIVAESLKSKCA